MNPEYVWTGEFDLNTLRVDKIIFESAKKNLRIQKYSDTCGVGLSHDDGNGNKNVKKKKKRNRFNQPKHTFLFISLPPQREIPFMEDVNTHRQIFLWHL